MTPAVSRKPSTGVVPPAPRPKPSFYLRARQDGVPDVLDAIQEIGGIAAPSQSAYAGKGDYDGFREAFTGPARLLVRSRGGLRPDALVEALTNPKSGIGQVFRLESTSDLYDAVVAAVKGREVDRRAAERGRLDHEFFERVLSKHVCGLNTQQLKVGDRFRVKRDKCAVTDLDPDTFEVSVECSPRFGRQKLPDNSPFNPERCKVEGKGNPRRRNPTDFFDKPESVAEQKRRLAEERERRQRSEQRESVRQKASARIISRSVDTTGDLFGATEGDAPLFALKKAFKG